jgi:hypothetical protein
MREELSLRPNGLALSCAASIDWESGRAESSFQNRPDLARRLRRQLQRRVGRQPQVILGPPQVRLLRRCPLNVAVLLKTNQCCFGIV